MRQAGFAGAIYPVNPHRALVQGEKAWAALADLPEVPEHVFVLSGTDSVLEAVAECGRLGVKVVTVLASGFSESGTEGAAREEALRAMVSSIRARICCSRPMRLLPNLTFQKDESLWPPTVAA